MKLENDGHLVNGRGLARYANFFFACNICGGVAELISLEFRFSGIYSVQQPHLEKKNKTETIRIGFIFNCYAIPFAKCTSIECLVVFRYADNRNQNFHRFLFRFFFD